MCTESLWVYVHLDEDDWLSVQIIPHQWYALVFTGYTGKNKIKQDPKQIQHTQNRFCHKMDPKTPWNCIHQVIFIQFPACRYSGDHCFTKTTIKSLCMMMRPHKQCQNKCSYTPGRVMWQFGSSSRVWTPMDGFHNLKLQSSPQKKWTEQHRVSSLCAKQYRPFQFFLFRHAYSLQNDMHSSWKHKRVSRVTVREGEGCERVCV